MFQHRRSMAIKQAPSRRALLPLRACVHLNAASYTSQLSPNASCSSARGLTHGSHARARSRTELYLRARVTPSEPTPRPRTSRQRRARMRDEPRIIVRKNAGIRLSSADPHRCPLATPFAFAPLGVGELKSWGRGELAKLRDWPWALWSQLKSMGAYATGPPGPWKGRHWWTS